MAKEMNMWKTTSKRLFTGALFVSLLLLFSYVQVAQAQVSSIDNIVSIAYLNVTPQPVIAGQNVTLFFRIYNSYDAALQDVNLELLSSSQLFNTSPAYSTSLGTIGSGEYGGVGTTGFFEYKFHIPSTLSAGEYTIDVVTNYYTTYGTQTNVPGQSTSPIYLYIYGTPNLELSGTLTGAINPGATTSANLEVLNTGTDTARNVSLTIPSNPNFTISGPAVINLGIIQAGSAASADISIQANQSLKAGVRDIPIELNYTAQSGVTYNVIRQFPISFLVSSPNIVASIESAQPSQLTPGGNQTAQVLIQNNGNGEAKNLTISFLSTNAIKVQSSASTIFIGTLAAGASAIESVQISATGSANQTTYNIPVEVHYNTIAGGNVMSGIAEMPVSLLGTATFNVTGISADLLPGATYSPITFTIKNTGNQPAEQVTLSLQTVFPITPSNPDAYITSLAPGQTTNVTFFVDVDTHGVNGTYPVTLYEQWKQPNSGSAQLFSNNNNYFAPVGMAVGAAATAQNYTWVWYAIVIIVVAVLVYRFRSKLPPKMQERIKQMEEKIKSKRKKRG